MRFTRVIVAGAGLSGLRAAHELAHAGAMVTLIDARDRVGGRVWTVRRGFADGQYGELGGEFIDEGHTRMHALAKHYGLELRRVLARGFTHRFMTADGPHLSRSGPWDALAEALAPLIRRYKVARGNDEAESIREMATYSLREWLRRQEVGPEVHAMVDSIRGFFLAEAEDLSVLPVVAQIAETGSPAQTPVFRIAGGNDQLVDALMTDTPARVLLAHRVTQIANAPDRVIVHMIDAQGLSQQIEGDAMVVALPASTLRDVEVTPPLPDEQRRAIARLAYGRATKVVVQCHGAGLTNHRARAFATDGPLGAFWDGTEGQARDTHGLIHFLGGGAASPALAGRAREGRLLSDLCWLGLAGASIAAMQVATWEDDPYARGGYAFADPGFDPACKALLAQRAGRMVFAGEHTSADFQGYMEGAVESGERAASELLQS